jgi:Cu/Ag efflux pump CusA
VSLGAIDFGMIVDGSVVVNAATPVAEMHDRRPHLWHRASQQDRVRDFAPGRK